MKLFNSIKSVLIFMTCIVIVAVVIDIYVFSNLVKENKQVISIAEQISNKLNQNKRNEISENIITKNQIDISKKNSYFVNGDRVVGFIESIESLGRQSGIVATIDNIQAEDFSFSSAEATSSLMKLQNLHLRIKTEGSWAGTYKFASLLESIPQKSALESVSFVKNDDSEKPKNSAWRGEFNLTAVVIK